MIVAKIGIYRQGNAGGATVYKVELACGVQGFTLEGENETIAEAEWMARQLRVALRAAGATVDDTTTLRENRFPAPRL